MTLRMDASGEELLEGYRARASGQQLPQGMSDVWLEGWKTAVTDHFCDTGSDDVAAWVFIDPQTGEPIKRAPARDHDPEKLTTEEES